MADALPPVLAAGPWTNNAELVVDVVRLYPLNHTTVDMTYGLGNFWTLLQPAHLVAHDLDPAKGDGVDWRALPEDDGTVETVVFDPPYVAKGGKETSTINQMNDAYGMLTTEKDPMLQWDKIVLGLEEAARITKPGGRLWFKAMNYVTGGRRFHFIRMAYDEMDRVGFDVVDEFLLVGGPGPQPKTNPIRKPRDDMAPLLDLDEEPVGTERGQDHARNNYSLLIIGRRRPPEAPTLF